MHMSKQETFDKVTTHLLTQNEKAMSNYDCLYRTNKGLTCAVGCLIPKSVYDSGMEYTDVEYVVDNWPELEEVLNQVPILKKLQKIHDGCDVDQWPKELRTLAKLEYLILPKILKKKK